MSEQAAVKVAELFRALSDPSRVRILATLLSREMNVGALARQIGISESAVSRQLRGLRQMHMVNSRRRGKAVYYWIADEHVVALFREGSRHARDG